MTPFVLALALAPASPAPIPEPAPPVVPTPPTAPAEPQIFSAQSDATITHEDFPTVVAQPLAPAASSPAQPPAPAATIATPAAPPAPAASAADDVKFRRIVFANTYTLNFGLFPVPSGDFQFFLGTDLRPRRRALGGQWNTAVGYQLSLSVGFADAPAIGLSDYTPRDTAESDEFAELYFTPVFFHRHAILAMGHGGPRGRLFYAFGGGVFMHLSNLAGIEGEGKLGYIFTRDLERRVKGVLGGQLRLGAGLPNGVPVPQFGLFLGLMIF